MKPDNTIYFGEARETPGGRDVCCNGRSIDPAVSRRLRNHSPDGFQWGYAGSGPAQLALALCLDFLEDADRALDVYQRFKFRVIATLDQSADWKLSGRQVREAVEAIEAERHPISEVA